MGCNDKFKNALGLNQLDRTRYFSRQLITADDLTQDQIYHREKRRMHNRLLHGWGIVCGLDVTATPTADKPMNITVSAGFALAASGDEIYVPSDVVLDLAQCVAGPEQGDCSRPCSPVIVGHVDAANPFYLGIKYAECQSRPVRVAQIDCGCDDMACEYSRIRDGFEIRCLEKLPESHNPETVQDLCEIVKNKSVPCPSAPQDAWIVLAKIKIKAPSSRALTANDIGSDDRRILVSNTILQRKLSMSECS